MTTTRLATAVAALVLSAGLTTSACSAGVTGSASSGPASDRSNSEDSTSPSASGSPGQVSVPPVPPVSSGTSVSVSPSGSASTGARLPVGFPLPAGSTVGTVVDDGSETDARITVTDNQTAFTFWRSALPGAGYTVVSAQQAFGAGEIRFSGHGCVGDSQIALTPGSGAAVQCVHG